MTQINTHPGFPQQVAILAQWLLVRQQQQLLVQDPLNKINLIT